MANRVTIPVTNFEALSPPWSLISLDTDLTTVQTGFNDSSLGQVNGIPTDTGAVNAYIVLLPFGVPVSYKQGMSVVFIPANTNTSSSTINVNGLGVVSLVSASGAALVAGQLVATNTYFCVYDGAAFRVLNLTSTGANVFGLPTDTGVVNAYVVTMPSIPLSYTAGMMVVFVPSVTNTGASTINVNSLGVKNITDQNNNALVAGALIAGTNYAICYDGTEFRLLTPTYGNSLYTTSFTVTTGATLTTITGWTLAAGSGLGVTYDGAGGFTMTNGMGILQMLATTNSAATRVDLGLIKSSGNCISAIANFPGGTTNLFGLATGLVLNVTTQGFKGSKLLTQIYSSLSSSLYSCTLSILTFPF